MAWVAVDKDGTECICSTEPYEIGWILCGALKIFSTPVL